MILYHPETLLSFYHGCDGLNSRIYPAGQLIWKISRHIEDDSVINSFYITNRKGKTCKWFFPFIANKREKLEICVFPSIANKAGKVFSFYFSNI